MSGPDPGGDIRLDPKREVGSRRQHTVSGALRGPGRDRLAMRVEDAARTKTGTGLLDLKLGGFGRHGVCDGGVCEVGHVQCRRRGALSATAGD